MGRLLVLFFLLPWWVYIPAAIGVYWAGERVYEQALETEAAKAAALGTAAPEPIDIATFDSGRDIHAAGEVNLVGLIDHDLDDELVERTNGVVTTTRYLHMIFGADEFGSKVVRGALMLDKREEAAFIDTKADDWAVDATPDYRVYAFNGFVDRSAKLDEMVDGAISEKGLTRAEDFVFIEPFFEGREAALSAHGDPEQSRQIGWAIAAFVALIGVVKRVTSVRARPVQDAEEEAVGLDALDPVPPAPEPEIYAGTAAAYAMPDVADDDTPIGRLTRRSRAQTVPAETEILSYTAYGAAASDPDEYDDYADEYAEENADEAFADEPVQAFVPEDDPAAVPPARTPQKSSAAAFYAKLALGMLVVGTLTYDPSFLSAGLPVAGIALFWFGIYLAFRRLRNGARRLAGRAQPAPQHTRRPDGGAQIDLTVPGRAGRRKPA